MFLYIFKHPITTDIILMSSSNTKQSSMVAYDSSAELRNIIFEIYKIFWLLMCRNIIEVNIFITPFKIMNDPFICQFLLDNEYILEELNNSFFDIKMIELGNHSLLIFQIPFISINQCISFINDVSDVIKHCAIST